MAGLKKIILESLEIILIPFVILSLFVFRKIRRLGIGRFKYIKRIFSSMGVFPLIDHYYDPLFNTSILKKSLKEDRDLPGIDWNLDEQISIINSFSYNEDLLNLEINNSGDYSFKFDNPSFSSGDAEYYYNIIRLYKPKKIIEIGSGNSTLLALAAVRQNKKDEINYNCEIICIEPYEAEWLEKLDVNVVRKKAEDIEKSFFLSLNPNDILFIDSSHMIRPQGDVLFEFLELLPDLNPGVLIHIHDIFSPKDYLEEWVIDSVCFWNEQYLLEAFLTYNNKFKIIGALNYLHHNHSMILNSKCPILAKEKNREPGSFWIQKI